MASLYPLRLKPILRRYLWGGRRLGTVLGKSLGEGDDYAESWEVVDHDEDQSIVLHGPLAGVTLAQLTADHGQALLGRHAPAPRFPLLFKFLDARRVLSVQVHPNDAQAARLDPPDLGKTEAWVVLEAEPGSIIHAGLKRGVDREMLKREIARGTTELCLHRFEPRPGDCIFLPAGLVHAIGAGLLIAEIQQASDVTYRLFDFNRLGPDGRLRPLHIEDGLAAVDDSLGPAAPQTPASTDRAHVSRLVSCDKFVLDRWDFAAPAAAGGDDRCHIVSVLEGEVEVAGDPAPGPLTKGSTVLLPVASGAVELSPRGQAVVLDAYLP